MNATTKTRSSEAADFGIDYDSFTDTPSGRHCAGFVRVGHRAIKIYNDRCDRDNQHMWQKRLASKGLAPGCDEKIDIVMSDGSVKYAFFTVVANMAVDGIRNRSDKNARIDQATTWGRKTGKSDYDNIRADKSELTDRMFAAGFNFNDSCDFNFGYINGRAVVVDCEVSYA